jgi:cysteinyl-tRNA synthetase
MADIQLHNTLSGKIENFVPQKAGEVRMYTCGPTVYDYAHIAAVPEAARIQAEPCDELDRRG